MTKRGKSGALGLCRLQLLTDPEAERALSETMEAHARLLDWLDRNVPPGHGQDLVILHRNFYESARAASGLQARAVTLAFKDWAQRRRGKIVEGLPLDEKLYGLKGIESVSIATLQGRVTIPFRVAGYGAEWNGKAPARLVKADPYALLIATGLNAGEANMLPREEAMLATESMLGRIGRVIAGMANAAIDAAEGLSPENVMEQSLREIDAAHEEVKAELGKATAERFQLEARLAELGRESLDLGAKIRVALEARRDDLAEAGVARQLDIETQSALLTRLIDEKTARIAELGETMDAVAASRREAQQRLKALRAAQGNGPGNDGTAAPPRDGALAKVGRANAAAERVTGVPSGPAPEAALRSLHELARQNEIAARLARLKSEAAE